jgi:heme/copper-type cytochrome/quinol oxidase subunit 4
MDNWWVYLVGYFFASFVAHVPVYVAMHQLRRAVWGKQPGPESVQRSPSYWWQPGLVGILERLLYTGAYQLGSPEFIAVWLAVKVTAAWGRWGEVHGRSIFNNFLIGNALSIIFAVVAAKSMAWHLAGEDTPAIVLPLATVGLTFLLWGWLKGLPDGNPTPEVPSKPDAPEAQCSP